MAEEDPRLQRCGFAKLEGEGFEYFIRKYEIVLGRSSKSTALDVVLGDNMNISRQHAKLVYNFDEKCFELIVLGKNGVTVGGNLYTPASPPQPLKSQDFVSVGDKSFYFLLPKSRPSLLGKNKLSAQNVELNSKRRRPEDSGAISAPNSIGPASVVGTEVSEDPDAADEEQHLANGNGSHQHHTGLQLGPI